jgi:hypothetical protein
MKTALMQLQVLGLKVLVTVDPSLEPGSALLVVPSLSAADRILGFVSTNGPRPPEGVARRIEPAGMVDVRGAVRPQTPAPGQVRPIMKLTRSSQAGRTAEYADVYAADRDGRLNVLTPTARDMVRLHFGVGGERFGYQDIAHSYGCTQREVQDIVKRALLQVGVQIKSKPNYGVRRGNVSPESNASGS